MQYEAALTPSYVLPYTEPMSDAGPVTYQRSQVEQAIARVEGLAGKDGIVPAALRSNVKRLLDIDRRPRARKLDTAPERFAFHDGSEGPGHGTEVAYTRYHTFALLVGMRLIGGGMPQSRTVMLLRELRDELERTFGELAATPLMHYPDDRPSAGDRRRPPSSPEERAQLARDGFLLHAPENMTFLVARTGPDAEALLVPGPDRKEFATGNICDFEALKDRLRFFSHEGQAATVVELTNAVHKLGGALMRTQVRRRGRPSVSP